MRLLWLFLGLAVLVMVPFLIWGEGLEGFWTRERLEMFGAWAWLAGIGLQGGDQRVVCFV